MLHGLLISSLTRIVGGRPQPESLGNECQRLTPARVRGDNGASVGSGQAPVGSWRTGRICVALKSSGWHNKGGPRGLPGRQRRPREAWLGEAGGRMVSFVQSFL